jgi:hypothetical protein
MWFICKGFTASDDTATAFLKVCAMEHWFVTRMVEVCCAIYMGLWPGWQEMNAN